MQRALTEQVKGIIHHPPAALPSSARWVHMMMAIVPASGPHTTKPKEVVASGPRLPRNPTSQPTSLRSRWPELSQRR